MDLNQSKTSQTINKLDLLSIQRKWAGQPLAMLETSVASIPGVICKALEENAAQAWERKIAAKYFKPKMEISGNVGIIPIEGAISKNVGFYEALWLEAFDIQWGLELIEQAARDGSIRGVLIDFDTPGGTIAGVPEFAAAVKKLARKKPVVSYTDDLLASAGYYMAAGSSEIIASDSSRTGSIGVYAAFYDMTALYERYGISVEVFRNSGADYKGEGLPGTKLSEKYKEMLKASIDESAKEFKLWVTSNREKVEGETMRGQVFNGRAAKKAGLVDRVGSFEFALSVLKQKIRENAG